MHSFIAMSCIGSSNIKRRGLELANAELLIDRDIGSLARGRPMHAPIFRKSVAAAAAATAQQQQQRQQQRQQQQHQNDTEGMRTLADRACL